MAMSRLHRLEKMDILDKPNRIDSRTFKTTLNDIPSSPRVVLKLKNLSVGYDKELCNITHDIISGSKIGIIGKNGTGKSTLLKTINGMIEPLSGKIIQGSNVSVGYFDQTLKMIDDNNTANYLKLFREISRDDVKICSINVNAVCKHIIIINKADSLLNLSGILLNFLIHTEEAVTCCHVQFCKA